jgi:type I restriction enzyme S subunit
MSEVSDDWKSTTVEEVCTFYKGGSSFRKKEYTENGVPVLAKGDIYPHGRIEHGGDRFAPRSYREEKGYRLTEDRDLLLTTRDLSQTGDYLGIVAPVPHDGPYFVNQGANVIQLNDKVEERFFVYWTHSRIYREHVTASAIGSTQVHLRKDDFLGAPLWLPPLPIQRRIADILGALDDKITLNRQMNETLEAMAQALYRHWFVDFGPFQDQPFVDSELGPIPEGWDVSTVGETCEINLGQSPKSEYYNEEGEGLPLHQGVSSYGWRFPVHDRHCTKPKRVADEGDILISVRAPVGRLNIADRKLIIGRGLTALRRKDGAQSFLLAYLKDFFDEEDKIGSGTVFNSITKKVLQGLTIIDPPSEVIERFEDAAGRFDQLIRNNHEETETLTETRDYLLPKLISGEIEVEAAEERVESAA